MSTYYLKNRARGAQSQPKYAFNTSSSFEEDQIKSIYKEALEKSLTLKRSQDPLEHSKVNLSQAEQVRKPVSKSQMASPAKNAFRGSKLENLRDKYLSQNSAIKELKESERSRRTEQNSQRPLNPFAIYKEIKAARRLEISRVVSQKRPRKKDRSKSKPKIEEKSKNRSTLFNRMKAQKVSMTKRMTKRRPINRSKVQNTTQNNIPTNLTFKKNSKNYPLKPTNSSFLTKHTQATSTSIQTSPKDMNLNLTTKAPSKGFRSPKMYQRQRKSSQPDLSRKPEGHFNLSSQMYTSAFKSKRVSINPKKTGKTPSFTDFNPKKVLNISIDKSSQDVSVSGIHFLTMNSDTHNYNSRRPLTPSPSENALSVQTKKMKNPKNFELEDLVNLQQKVIVHLLNKDRGAKQKPAADISRFIDQISRERGIIENQLKLNY